ncbi:MAG: energy transducer TonB [Gemmatimonadaceae bacterium]
MTLKFLRAGFVALAMISGPFALTAHAQDEKIYPINEVTNPPKLSSEENASKLILASYPEDLKRRHIGGVVELQFVVDSKGNVDASSVEIVETTQTVLGEAAKRVVARLTFAPGKLNGTCVKTRVILPIVYKVAS